VNTLAIRAVVTIFVGVADMGLFLYEWVDDRLGDQRRARKLAMRQSGICADRAFHV
jgi:hypothetical protein